MSITFKPIDALGYHGFQQLEEKFLDLNNKNSDAKKSTDEEVKKRIPTTFYGKNGSNVLGYLPIVGTLQAIFKAVLFTYLDGKLNRELKELGTTDEKRTRVIHEIKDFHKWEKVRAAIEFTSLGFLLIVPDLLATLHRNKASMPVPQSA